MLQFTSAKSANETVIATFSFAGMMAASETVSTPSATAPTLTISNILASADGKGVSCLVSGGVNGSNYPITFGALTSQSQQLYQAVLLCVRVDPANPNPPLP